MHEIFRCGAITHKLIGIQYTTWVIRMIEQCCVYSGRSTARILRTGLLWIYIQVDPSGQTSHGFRLAHVLRLRPLSRLAVRHD